LWFFRDEQLEKVVEENGHLEKPADPIPTKKCVSRLFDLNLNRKVVRVVLRNASLRLKFRELSINKPGWGPRMIRSL